MSTAGKCARRRVLAGGIAMVVVMVTTVACSSTGGSSSSRAKAYSSLGMVAEDSTDVVVGSPINKVILPRGDAPSPDDTFLQIGQQYLLFLLPTNLPPESELRSDFGSWFYITGGYAGMYEQQGGERYSRARTDQFDSTPKDITRTEVQRLP